MIHKRTILLVEDEAVIALAQLRKLAQFGFEVEHALDGEGALALVEARPDLDLVLMDIDLGPGMDGTETARRILARRHLPILFLSSHAEEEYVERVREITRYGYVVKNSGDFVLRSSIEMAFELFDSHRRLERKMGELEDKEAFLDRVLETLPLPVFVKDREGRYLRANRALCELLGKPASAIVGKTVFEAYDDELARTYHEHDLELMREGGVQSYETLFRVPQGLREVLIRKASYSEGEGGIAGLIGIIEDITARKAGEEDLRRRKEEFELIFNLVPAQIWYKDDKNRFLRVNRRVCEDIGLPAEAIEGHYAEELFPDYAAKYYADDLEVLRSGKPKLGILEEVNRATGEIRVVQTDKIPAFDREGRTTGLIAFAADVTERVRAETELGRLLAEKELVLCEVHHRIKNNMKTLESLLNLQAASLGENSAGEALDDAAGRLRSMMLLYEKLYRASEFGSLSLASYLPELVEEIVDNFPQGDRVRVDCRIEELSLDAKRISTLGMIVNELVTNSMKYAFRGRELGLVRVCADGAPGGRLRLSVRDDGPGFPEDLDLRSGSSFGLSLVRLLAEQLGGEVRFARGPGAEVILEMPLAAEARFRGAGRGSGSGGPDLRPDFG